MSVIFCGKKSGGNSLTLLVFEVTSDISAELSCILSTVLTGGLLALDLDALETDVLETEVSSLLAVPGGIPEPSLEA